jgi:glyoxylase-like metal-dependent hydrolase (beta-lactamase superfamily II)
VDLTKYAHSCVRLAEGAEKLVIDPGNLGDNAEALSDAHHVLVTHEHPDHIDVDPLLARAEADPDLRVWAPASVAKLLAALGDRVVTVEPNVTIQVGEFEVRTFGGQHALIHPQVPMVANVGYLVNETVYHPGDSLVVPPIRVPTALAPIHAPWSKISEVIDYVIGVRAAHVHQIHDGLLNGIGLKMASGHLSRFASAYGGEFAFLEQGDTVTAG